MKRANNISGFSLLELLTVIAIIAILAAVLFPVFKAVKDNAKRGACITNLKNIGAALQQYKLDNRVYPTVLLARYEMVNGNLVDSAGNPMPATMAEGRGGLFPEYVKSIKDFRCPAANASAFDQAVGPLAASERDGTIKEWYYYAGDSYDHAEPANNSFMASYATVWAATEVSVSTFAVSDPPWEAKKDTRDFARQLRWRVPDNTTVVTWCLNHKNSGDKALVLFLDASVDVVPAGRMIPEAVPGGQNVIYRILPE